MSLSAVLVLNAVLDVAILAALAYVCLIPFRFGSAVAPVVQRVPRAAAPAEPDRRAA